MLEVLRRWLYQNENLRRTSVELKLSLFGTPSPTSFHLFYLPFHLCFTYVSLNFDRSSHWVALGFLRIFAVSLFWSVALPLYANSNALPFRGIAAKTIRGAQRGRAAPGRPSYFPNGNAPSLQKLGSIPLGF